MGRKFYRALRQLAAKLGCQPHDLLAVIYLESGCKPSAFNKITNAVGLIQFLPSTLKALGYAGTVYDFQKLSAWEQVPFISLYLSRVAEQVGPIADIVDLYLAVLYPAAVGTQSTAVMVAGSSAYEANKGLDLDADGVISRDDIRKKFEIITAQVDFDRYLTEMFWDGSQGSPYPPDIIAEIALRYVDCGNRQDQDRYLEVMCGPEDKDAAMLKYMLAGPSTCALFARGVWRLAGVESGILSSRYRIGHAVSDIVEIARANDAWHPSPTTFLQKGDVIIVTDPEHVVVCVSDPREMSPTSFEIDTIEGGQSGPSGGSSYVKRFARGLELVNGKLMTRGARPRRVLGRADACELLPASPHGSLD